jgi:hypothetical protein
MQMSTVELTATSPPLGVAMSIWGCQIQTLSSRSTHFGLISVSSTYLHWIAFGSFGDCQPWKMATRSQGVLMVPPGIVSGTFGLQLGNTPERYARGGFRVLDTAADSADATIASAGRAAWHWGRQRTGPIKTEDIRWQVYEGQHFCFCCCCCRC